MDKVARHKEITNHLTSLFELKNAKYGNSTKKTYDEYGPTSFLLRIDDKLNRLKTLLLKDESDTQDERVLDTLIDLANYSIIAILDMDLDKEELKC